MYKFLQCPRSMEGRIAKPLRFLFNKTSDADQETRPKQERVKALFIFYEIIQELRRLSISSHAPPWCPTSKDEFPRQRNQETPTSAHRLQQNLPARYLSTDLFLFKGVTNIYLFIALQQLRRSESVGCGYTNCACSVIYHNLLVFFRHTYKREVNINIIIPE